ncbi:hypothetical protein BDFG_01013 [Blastomyces dermatitidis ATCC 26199]|nr:hypothetical protein BDFG_01013 [Blastomyces dermatitidis ATCC 26199]
MTTLIDEYGFAAAQQVIPDLAIITPSVPTIEQALGIVQYEPASDTHHAVDQKQKSIAHFFALEMPEYMGSSLSLSLSNSLNGLTCRLSDIMPPSFLIDTEQQENFLSPCPEDSTSSEKEPRRTELTQGSVDTESATNDNRSAIENDDSTDDVESLLTPHLPNCNPRRVDSARKVKRRRMNFWTSPIAGCIPTEEMIEPDSLYCLLIQQCGKDHNEEVPRLVRLFYAIASPYAFKQLAEAYVLDSKSTLRTLLRRFFLVRLLDSRNQSENSFKIRRTQSAPGRDCKNKDRARDSLSGRPDSNAVQDLLFKFYPHIKHVEKWSVEYKEKHTKLKNRLKWARNWYLLRQKFSSGLLALVPCGDELRIGIDWFQTIPIRLFSIFLDILDKYRGEFLRNIGDLISTDIEVVLCGSHNGLMYGFEHEDTEQLLIERMDSGHLIDLCQQGNVTECSF